MAAPGLDLADVQGLVYNGYKNRPFAGFVLARLADNVDANRAWLKTLRLATAVRADARRPGPKVHVAFGEGGLVALGVPYDVHTSLPQELKDGMAKRARTLGDTPEDWDLGGLDDRLDVLLLIYASSPGELSDAMADHRARLVAAGATVRPDEIAAEATAREHFGFVDGLSQPFVPGVHDKARSHEHPIALGEMLLGYLNAYDKMPASPRYADHFDLGANGTYVVFRKLAQHVGTLWTYVAEQAKAFGTTPEYLAAKMLGRWPSGAPLALAPHVDSPEHANSNTFGFLDHDPDGIKCPIAAHIRRANPRDARDGNADTSQKVVARHRILRRGRKYGPSISIEDAIAGRDDGTPRGLYFVGLGASIARGFEFIQQSWLRNPGFHGLDGESDPIVSAGGCPFTIPTDPIRIRLPAVPRIVTTLGGGYFFMPSLAAIERLSGS